MQFSQTGLERCDFGRREIVLPAQGNDGQRPRPAAVKDRLLNRRRALIRDAVTGDSHTRQLHNHLMIVTTTHMPTVTIELLQEALCGPADVEVMRQRQCDSLNGRFRRLQVIGGRSSTGADRSEPIASEERPSADGRRQGGRCARPPAVRPRLKPRDFHSTKMFANIRHRERASPAALAQGPVTQAAGDDRPAPTRVDFDSEG